MAKGKLKVWKDDKGFGFIKPDHGKEEVFLHISALKDNRYRPQVGDVINYQITVDKDGKTRACNAYIEGINSQKITTNLMLMAQVILLSLIPLWGSINLVIQKNMIPLILYILMSIITFFLYKHDKYSAKQGDWRISEGNLHFCEFMGGWIGAFIAQQTIKHKNSKQSYQFIFWIIVSVHLIIWSDWLFFDGKLLKIILALK